MRIRPLSTDAERALVARRMRLTLVEVLGEARGTAMYSLEWLEGRVDEHLHRDDAAVLLAESGAAVSQESNEADDGIAGHTILRVESDGDGRFGLFSTTFVAPDARRQGIGRALLQAGEDWMRARSLPRAATMTAADNHRLIAMYTGCGYRIVARSGEMVRLERRL